MHSEQTSVLVGCEGGVIYDLDFTTLGLQADAGLSYSTLHKLHGRHRVERTRPVGESLNACALVVIVYVLWW